jgi:LacI family transcriptional regulator
MAGRVTIQDIADELGVSRNTVSKAINNTGILADATRDKILQKAVEMGYKQFSYVTLNTQTKATGNSASPKSVVSASTMEANAAQQNVSGGVIALFTTALLTNSHFSSTMLDKMQRELSYLGYSITIHRIRYEDVDAMVLPNSFHKESTAAIICIEMFDAAYSDMVCDLGLPTLFVDSPVSMCTSTLKADRLLMDNRSEIYSFVNEMARRGKTKIGFIGEASHCMSFFERYMAFQEAMNMLDLPIDRQHCIIKNKTGVRQPGGEEYREYLTECIQSLTELPDVFICANDFVAIDTLQVFRKLGISVPDDVYLCGFDDSPESRVVTPPLTSIHIHSQIMGFSAVHLLISRIQNPAMNYRTIYTETSLMYRESTGD